MRTWHSKLTSREIYAIRRRGVCLKCELFSTLGVPGKSCSRAVIVVSKRRVDKKAVLRNKAKRRVRAAIDQSGFGLLYPPMDIMVILNKQVLFADFSELLQEIKDKIAKLSHNTPLLQVENCAS